jgi:hypothetical protein
MSTPATYDDVNLILRLYELRREQRLREARAWFVKNFKVKNLDDLNRICPPNTDENANFRMVVSYWEMVSSFITAGVLNEDLFFQSGRELLLCWTRIEPVLEDARQMHKDPLMWKNLETVAKTYIQALKRNGPEAYSAFAARVGG